MENDTYSWSNTGEILLQNEYKFNTNTIYSIYFHSNQLQAEDASKITCKSHESRLARARIFSRLEAGTLPNLVFSDEKKFDVQHHANPQNDRV